MCCEPVCISSCSIEVFPYCPFDSLTVLHSYKDWLNRSKMAANQSDDEGGASSDDERHKKQHKKSWRGDRLQVVGGGHRRGE